MVAPFSSSSSAANSSFHFRPILASNQDAAALLLQVRDIAHDELLLMTTRTTARTPSPPSLLPESNSFPEDISRPTTTTPIRIQQTVKAAAPETPQKRLRLVSVCSYDDDVDNDDYAGDAFAINTKHASPNSVCVTPLLQRNIRPLLMPKTLQDPIEQNLVLEAEDLFENEEEGEYTNDDDDDDDDFMEEISTRKNPPQTVGERKKTVGDKLPPNTALKGVLRKKFSWKSFPELEAYLVSHRPRYLEYSSSLNYTKAQKRYNNRLTQGLLDLASAEGYIFEGFTFAAVRDRIRCFYKSYVQAIKKKTKKDRKQKRGRSRSL